jgi:NitT/TauT family transport system permease protein
MTATTAQPAADQAAIISHRVPGEPRPWVVWGGRLTVLVALLGGWHWLGTSSAAWMLVVSSPTEVASTLAQVLGPGGPWWADLATTLQEAAAGFLLGVVAAVLLVAVMVPSPLLARFVAPFIAAANSLPVIVLAPMFIVWFGISQTSKVYFVATAIFFIVFYGLYTGIRSTDRLLLDNARALGARPHEVIWHVYVPAILNWIIAGLRLSSAWALLAAVVAEYLGANQGLGFQIATAQQELRADVVIAGIVVVATLAVVLDRAFMRIEVRFSRWRVF